MADISLQWNQALGICDWTVVNGQLVTGQDLETAVTMSIFTWRRDLPFNQYGWWGDSFDVSETGSRLPELLRAIKSNAQNLILQCNGIISEAVDWLIVDGIVASFSISSSFVTPTQISSQITATMPDATVQTFSYAWAWSQLGF